MSCDINLISELPCTKYLTCQFLLVVISYAHRSLNKLKINCCLILKKNIIGTAVFFPLERFTDKEV